MKIHFFNPENDLALADGNANYCPPPAARAIAGDLATLPLWYAQESDSVFLPGILHSEFHKEMSALFPLARPGLLYRVVRRRSMSVARGGGVRRYVGDLWLWV